MKNRDRLGSQNFKTKLDRDIAKFFRPTWISKSKLGRCTKYSDKELELLVAAGQGLGNIIKLDRVQWDKNTHSSSVPDKEMKLLQSFRYQQLYGQPSPQLQLSPVTQQPSTNLSSRSPFSGSSVQRTYGRTYSRAKVKQSLSRSNTPVETISVSTPQPPQNKKHVGDTINLVPPSQATIVGFRGLLLRDKYLRDINSSSDTVRQERDLVDNTIRMGMNNPDLTELPVDLTTSDKDQSQAHLAADRLLVSRIIQLFLWPAKMSSVDPPKQENLFSDSDDEIVVPVNESTDNSVSQEVFDGPDNDCVGDNLALEEEIPFKRSKVDGEALLDSFAQ